MLRAINEDGVNVQAYTAWSLMDNLEWAKGYSERFGLHWTNYTGMNLKLFVSRERSKTLTKTKTAKYTERLQATGMLKLH